jgi:hypothetical protein
VSCDQVYLYISAASDLRAEREILGRAVTEVPVPLGWRIVHSPAGDEPVDLEAVVQADLHLLLLGSDIRAPIGLEWQAARRAGREPVLYLQERVLRTPAAQDFVRFVAQQGTWRRFQGLADLRSRVLRLLTRHILEHAQRYALSPVEMIRLQSWRAELESAAGEVGEAARGGAGESGVLLSRERYVPSDGVLLQDRNGEDQ